MITFDSIWWFYFQVGDGTTSVVLLTAEFLKHAKPFIEDGVHQRVIIRAFKKAATMVGAIFFFKMNDGDEIWKKLGIFPTSHQVKIDMKSFYTGCHAQIETHAWPSQKCLVLSAFTLRDISGSGQ